MKICLLMLIFSTNLLAQTITLLPKDVRVLRPGDISWVYAQSQDITDWASLKNTSIGDLYYVLDYKEVDNGVLMEIIVKEAPQVDPKAPSPPTPDKVKVVLSGLELDLEGAKSAQQIVNLDLRIEYGKNWRQIIIFLICAFIFIGMTVGLYLYSKRLKKMKAFNQEKLILKELLGVAKNRKEIESIAMSRKKITEYFMFDETDWKRFQSQLDIIQFKQHWSTEELNIAQKALDEFKNNLREKAWNSKI